MFDLLNSCGTSEAVKKCRQQCKYFGVPETDTVRVDFQKIVEAIWNPGAAASATEGAAGDAEGQMRFETELRRSRQEYEERRSRESAHEFPFQVSRQQSSAVQEELEEVLEHGAVSREREPQREAEARRRREAEEQEAKQRSEEEEQRLRRAEEEARRVAEEQEARRRHNEEAARRWEEEERMRAEEREKEEAMESEKRVEERRRRAAEVQAALQAEHNRREEQEQERRRGEEEQRKRLLEVQLALQAEESRQEETRQRKDKEVCLEQVSERLEQTTKEEKLKAFLAANGFKTVNEKKKQIASLKTTTSFASMAPQFTYPLHAAVRAKDPEAASALLWGGADPTLLDSQKCTALALAQKLNRKESHAEIIAVLAA